MMPQFKIDNIFRFKEHLKKYLHLPHFKDINKTRIWHLSNSKFILYFNYQIKLLRLLYLINFVILYYILTIYFLGYHIIGLCLSLLMLEVFLFLYFFLGSNMNFVIQSIQLDQTLVGIFKSSFSFFVWFEGLIL